MESAHPFSVSFAPCFQAVLCRSRLFFRMFLDKLFQICANRFIMKQKRRCFSPFLLSPSSQRAWIEMRDAPREPDRRSVALLAEGVDRNGQNRGGGDLPAVSPSSQRAWIEMRIAPSGTAHSVLSPSSQRAWIEILARRQLSVFRPVALLAEGVDRNRCSSVMSLVASVALLAEGVDRNLMISVAALQASTSPSSQRAWIEMELVYSYLTPV